jgi:hypothetical protein
MTRTYDTVSNNLFLLVYQIGVMIQLKNSVVNLRNKSH